MKKNTRKFFYVATFIVIAIFALTSCNLSKKDDGKISFDNKKVKEVKSLDDLNKEMEKYNVKISPMPENTGAIYGIENGNVATVKYKIKGNFTGEEMTFLMKSSSSQEDNLVGLNNDWGTQILMRVDCTDGSDIEVTSCVAMDNTKVMKAEWYDNDLYYCMTTDDLVTREDFLQEVNRVIITNHIE